MLSTSTLTGNRSIFFKYEISLQNYNKIDRDTMKNIPVMPVASKPRYFVMGKRCVTLV